MSIIRIELGNSCAVRHLFQISLRLDLWARMDVNLQQKNTTFKFFVCLIVYPGEEKRNIRNIIENKPAAQAAGADPFPTEITIFHRLGMAAPERQESKRMSD